MLVGMSESLLVDMMAHKLADMKVEMLVYTLVKRLGLVWAHRME